MSHNKECPPEFYQDCCSADNCPALDSGEIMLLGKVADRHYPDSLEFREEVRKHASDLFKSPEAIFGAISKCECIRMQILDLIRKND